VATCNTIWFQINPPPRWRKGERLAESNQPRAIARLAKRLAQLDCERVLIEGGSYQNVLVGALRAAELPVMIINPRRVREFAKTDPIDARVLAAYGERIQPPVRELPDEQNQMLRGSGSGANS
jgi:transposase